MENSNFQNLLERYLTGNLSEAERKKLDAWLDAEKSGSPRNLSRDEAEKLFQRISEAITQDKEIPVTPRRTPVYAIAASVIVLIALAFWIFRDTVLTGNKDVEKLLLQDGSIVWLRPGSTLAYVEKPNTRYAVLTGEGLFEVAKDPTRPFLVDCGEISVKVLGTSFNIRSFQDSLELSVLTGRVQLSSSYDSVGQVVEANNKVMYSAIGTVSSQQLAPAQIQSLTMHTEYNMNFTAATLQEVAARIGEKFNVTVTFSSPALRNCHITADFTDNSLPITLQMISEILPLQYSISGNNVTLTGTGCNPSNNP